MPASWRREPIAARSSEASRVKAHPAVKLGLRANWRQFAILVAVNAFVGGMVGVERSTLAPLAGHDFHVASRAAIFSFLISFGLVKAASNFMAGRLADRLGRRGVLLLGWSAALPVPLLIIFAPSWGWVVFANVLLGLNQGLAWSTTVNMKIDLVGPRHRGFALGLNEASGYLAVSGVAAVAGFLAASYGIRPWPYLLAEGLAICGLLLSLLTSETAGHVELESAGALPSRSVTKLFLDVSFRDRTMSSACQAGMVNNLNDGMAWALLPLFFAAHRLGLREIGVLAGAYPAVWGAGQLGTGWLSDRLGRKGLIVTGMLLQALAIAGVAFLPGFGWWFVESLVLGAGTALVYPTLLAVIGDSATTPDRATSVGIYRLWRDSGYAVGAIVTGVIADAAGFPAAIIAVAVLTAVSGTLVAFRMRETMVLTAGRIEPSER
jgi:MFS family permease